MCVLTYIPTSKNGFILSSNRDEATLREAAIPPRKYIINGCPIFYPKDPRGGGTWIASCGKFALCLLNGAFQKHVPNPPYRQSRGKVILDFYSFQGVQDFVQNYDFTNIEPFTLVIIENINALTLNEIRWDGQQAHLKNYPADQPHIWSSATLYSDEIIAERQTWFSDFLSHKTITSSEEILPFHHNGGKEDTRNAIKMNRDDELKTISITQFQIDETAFRIRYEDLIKQKNYDFRVFAEC
jgi:Transport and Golgi organisation 2